MGDMKLITSIGRNHWRATLVTALFLATACGSGGSASSASPSSKPSSDAAMMHHAAVDVLSSRYGQVLVDGQGRALYLFAADTTTQSTCYDACATAWPPMLADKGTPVGAMHGASTSLTGTTTRKDGTLQ